MTIQSTTPFAAFAASTSPSAQNSSSSSSSSATGGLGGSSPSESMFLQLLVAQLKNQDPTTPSDPTQFVGELAQFSQLEQTIQIRQDSDTIAQSINAPAATTTAGTTNSSGTNQAAN